MGWFIRIAWRLRQHITLCKHPDKDWQYFGFFKSTGKTKNNMDLPICHLMVPPKMSTLKSSKHQIQSTAVNLRRTSFRGGWIHSKTSYLYLCVSCVIHSTVTPRSSTIVLHCNISWTLTQAWPVEIVRTVQKWTLRKPWSQPGDDMKPDAPRLLTQRGNYTAMKEVCTADITCQSWQAV